MVRKGEKERREIDVLWWCDVLDVISIARVLDVKIDAIRKRNNPLPIRKKKGKKKKRTKKKICQSTTPLFKTST